LLITDVISKQTRDKYAGSEILSYGLISDFNVPISKLHARI